MQSFLGIYESRYGMKGQLSHYHKDVIAEKYQTKELVNLYPWNFDNNKIYYCYSFVRILNQLTKCRKDLEMSIASNYWQNMNR